MPPVPPAGREPVRQGAAEPARDRRIEAASATKPAKHQGDGDNIRQNTRNQGYQQDR
jgi:hypothetical protein